MATVTLKGTAFHTSGNIPAKGATSPDFKLVARDLSEVALSKFAGKKKVLNIFPSIDTSVCATSVRHFNKDAAALQNSVVINISADLPFALGRFCGAEGIANAETLSCFRSSFATDFGLKMIDGPLAGLCARAVVVLDEQNRVIHSELVSEIASEPNYDAALNAVRG